jgi:hypothetical protein
MGANRVNATELIQDLCSRGMTLATAGGKLCLEGKGAQKLSDTDRERIQNLKAELIAELESASEEKDEERPFRNNHSMNQDADLADGTTNGDSPPNFQGACQNLSMPQAPAPTPRHGPSAIPCCGGCEYFETPCRRATPGMTYGCCMATPYDKVLMPKWPDDRPRRGRCPSFMPRVQSIQPVVISSEGYPDSAPDDEMIHAIPKVQHPDERGRVKCVYCVQLQDGICMISQELMYGISLLRECPNFVMREHSPHI